MQDFPQAIFADLPRANADRLRDEQEQSMPRRGLHQMAEPLIQLIAQELFEPFIIQVTSRPTVRGPHRETISLSPAKYAAVLRLANGRMDNVNVALIAQILPSEVGSR